MQAPGAGPGSAGAAGARPLHARARPVTPARNLVDESDSESVSAFDDDADDTSDQEWAAADDLPARATHHHASSSSWSSTMPPAGVTAIPLPMTETEPLLPASAARLRGERSWGATWATLKTRARYYVPALSWIPNYDPRNLPHDFLAGATVAMLLLPQGLSYASSLAKLDPVVGLYTAFAPVAFYAFFGTSRQLSVGPEALVSILVGSAITKNAVLRLGDGTEFNEEAVMAERATLAATLSLLVGIFTFLLGFFRFGFIDSMLSRALLRGFITAVALVIMIEQAPTLLGMPLLPGGLPALEPLPPVLPIPTSPPTVTPSMYWSTGTAEAVEPDDDEPSAFDLLLTLLSRLHETHMPTLLLSIVSIAFLLITAAVKQRIADRFHRPWVKLIPEILILVVATITLSWAYDWRAQGIDILGRVRFSGLPVPRFPLLKPFSVIRGLTIPAILISVIGFVESIVVTKSYAGAHNYPVSRNRELVALGVANLAGAFFHAYPAFGSLARSRVADRVGARTQLAGLVAAALVLVAIFCLLPCFEYLPKAVMASIILVAALSLVETHDIAFMLQLHAWKDLMFMLFTFALTVFVSIEAGVLVSIALSLLLVVKDVAIPRITLLGRVRPATPAAPTAHGTAIPPSVLAQRRIKYRSMVNFQDAQLPPNDDDDTAGTVVVRIDEPLHFANTGELRDRLSRAERFGSLAAHPSETPRRRAPVRHVVFDVHHMPRIDASAVQILAEIVAQYRNRGVAVSFVRLRPALRKKFARAGITALVGEERFVRRIADALRVGASGEGVMDAGVEVVEVGVSDRAASGAEDHGAVSAEASPLLCG
ncbi:Solute carrier 26 [Allomyces arbusculus]|nr:Solute carrier 26 [Allomyces arbusculus]